MAGEQFIFQGLSDIGRGFAQGQERRANRLIQQQQLDLQKERFGLQQKQFEQNKLLQNEQILDLQNKREQGRRNKATVGTALQNVNRLIQREPTTETTLQDIPAQPFQPFQTPVPTDPFDFSGVQTEQVTRPAPIIAIEDVPENVAASAQLLQTTKPQRGRKADNSARNAAKSVIDDFIGEQVKAQFPTPTGRRARGRGRGRGITPAQATERDAFRSSLEAQFKQGDVPTREATIAAPLEDFAANRFLTAAGVPSEVPDVSPQVREEVTTTTPAPILTREAVFDAVLQTEGFDELSPEMQQRLFKTIADNVPIETEEEALALEQGQADLTQTLLENQKKLNVLSGNDPALIAREVPFFGTHANTKEGAAKVNELAGSTLSANENIDRLLGMVDDFGLTGRALSRAEAAKARSIVGVLKGQLRLGLIGPGAVSQFEQELLNDLIANPSRIFSLRSTTRASLTELRQLINSELVNKATALGVDTGQPVQPGQGQTSTGLSFTVTPL